mmetsp:Transcript_4195/g.10417  ORF Transcript_4195/g.10417 Transcript_4195/m.10417 type:complete len:346 (-) Transcript_4195:374-1411(-)
MESSSSTVDGSAPITVDAVTSSSLPPPPSSSSSSSLLELICSVAGWMTVDSIVDDVGICAETFIVSIVISVVKATAAVVVVVLSSVGVDNSTDSNGFSLTFTTSSASCDVVPETDASSSSWDGVSVTVVDVSFPVVSFGCSCFVTTISTFFNDWWMFVLCCSVVVTKVVFGGIVVVANGVVETKADNDSDVITFFLPSFSSSSFSFDGDSCFMALVHVDDERCFFFVFFFFFFSLCFFLMVELDAWLLLSLFSVVAIPSSRWTMPVGVNCFDVLFNSSFSVSSEGLVGDCDLMIFFLRFVFVFATFELATSCCCWKCLIPLLPCRAFFFFFFFFIFFCPSCSSVR